MKNHEKNVDRPELDIYAVQKRDNAMTWGPASKLQILKYCVGRGRLYILKYCIAKVVVFADTQNASRCAEECDLI
jgi:hypothetical protein